MEVEMLASVASSRLRGSFFCLSFGLVLDLSMLSLSRFRSNSFRFVATIV